MFVLVLTLLGSFELKGSSISVVSFRLHTVFEAHTSQTPLVPSGDTNLFDFYILALGGRRKTTPSVPHHLLFHPQHFKFPTSV